MGHRMYLTSATAALTALAEEGAEHGALNPWLVGGLVLAALLAMLWVTTLLNRDR
ncbi:hypothetical protein FNQ90_22615 [Streptomyces alkaliphilus]|uniref:Uncharacterized protein n=2 Tax=Streptomyces alkaliphilus TaxID=1472722 RepID=A0A7W3Y3Y0_9ACTN|nr:hypothetical protein [Streptomyces alkaliphilus]